MAGTLRRQRLDIWRQDRVQRRLCGYWAEGYDWRRHEAVLNSLGSHRSAIDGANVHFLPLLSQEPDALPIVPTHGSPGSPHHRGGGPTPLQRRYWNEQPRGSHFAAFEVPDLFIDDVRAFARLVH
jgi:Epoxide hydrolase N terminus